MDRILGVAIGLVTVLLVLSIIASHMQEIWASYSARRAASLEFALTHMLGDPNLSAAFFAHPLIQAISFAPARSAALSPGAPERRPSYIASDLFNKVLQSILVSANNLNAQELPAIVRALPDSPIKTRIATVTLGLEDDVKACNTAVEKWYDDTMDRVSGLYKRNTQVTLLLLGLGLAVVCNANLLRVASTLWTSAAARDELSAIAQGLVQQRSNTTQVAPTELSGATPAEPAKAGKKDTDAVAGAAFTKNAYDVARENLESLPVGYGSQAEFFGYWNQVRAERYRGHLGEWLFNVFGWLLTAVAVSLGAPFWFDLINKLINTRLVGQKPPATTQSR